MKKKIIEFNEPIEKFKIPQIDFSMRGLIRRKDTFKKSAVCSPIHGTHVVDKNHYIDNSGSVDIDYNYDFIRSNKHISDEELERRHGTKYYEFTFVNDSMKDAYVGADYSKKEEKEEVSSKQPKEFSFISTADEVFNEQIKPQAYENAKQEESYTDPSNEFKLNLKIDDSQMAYEYNTYDNNMPKPNQTNIPTFLTPKEEKPINNDGFELNETLTFGQTPSFKAPEINFDNPAVDKNQTIEEAIKKMQMQNSYQPPVKEETQVQSSYADYSIPYQRIFKKSDGMVDEHPIWLEEKKEIINQLLKSFSIDGEVITYTKGPAFTRYEILLAPGVNVKKVNQIYDNLQKDLQAKSLRMQAPIPGKNTIGIEVPNDVMDVVSFGDIINEEFMNNNKPLSIAMGKNIDGSPVYQNITDMPHALIAGATQSGKSVCINTILISLLIKNSPESLRLILVDPKKVELSFYNDLPHLLTPVIDDAIMATEALKWSVKEMERRYEVLARNRVRNIGDYNKKRKEHKEMENMPFIVIVVDEFNDLVMQCGAEANDCIIRLAQKARACGMHIILATQRPTVDVVNGTIKANITCRIAFRVASDVDSRTILDEIGAESLLGRGDMLIKNNGNPLRAQGAYISDDEINDVCEYISQRYQPQYVFTHDDLKKSINNSQSHNGMPNQKEAPVESEELLYQIALACVQQGVCSINSIQNGFGLGFNRAQRIVQILEEREIVSPKNGTKGREILVDSYKLREMFNIDEE
ncbi:TPA: DNA translocase FtsK [Candidatus Avacholeplasma faecigallinarum]|nr:DNA translocase FtsK [Candidatus Avacholeplasma faecigallinarum]